jgi:hypothetical protein
MIRVFVWIGALVLFEADAAIAQKAPSRLAKYLRPVELREVDILLLQVVIG